MQLLDTMMEHRLTFSTSDNIPQTDDWNLNVSSKMTAVISFFFNVTPELTSQVECQACVFICYILNVKMID